MQRLYAKVGGRNIRRENFCLSTHPDKHNANSSEPESFEKAAHFQNNFPQEHIWRHVSLKTVPCENLIKYDFIFNHSN